MNSEDSNAYDILHVAPTATETDIQKSYLGLCKKWHPDRGTTEADIQDRTQMMYQINAAKTILLDASKRRRHDELLKYIRENGEAPKMDRGAGYQNGYEFFGRPRPSGLGVPFQGSSSSVTNYECSTSGSHGSHGVDGRNGRSGLYDDSDGSNGSPAGAATPGTDAGNMTIRLCTVVANEGHLEVDIQEIQSMFALVDLSRGTLKPIPHAVFGSLLWSAVGGNGGNGGDGGHGGHGARRSRGKNANKYDAGGDGGPGGDGGDGGAGSSGASGGRGGKVDIELDTDDAYLLMRVDGCHPRDEIRNPLVKGGKGGRAGQHGLGGYGGAGGSGGDSYWSGDTNRPGGESGKSGARGRTSSIPLRSGANGAYGKLQIILKSPDGKKTSYRSRYNLAFEHIVTEKLSRMIEENTFEFGESVIIPEIKVRNTGGMKTPKQRVLIRFGTVTGVKAEMSGALFLPAGTRIPRGSTGFADEGNLQFHCPTPKFITNYDNESKPKGLVVDFDPILRNASFIYRAYQLGHENYFQDISKISDFQARYADFQSGEDKLRLAYPVENQNGVRGFRSLAPMETSIVELDLKSTTYHELGEISKTGRELFIQLYYADHMHYEIPIEKITVRAEEGKIVQITPQKANGEKGYRYVVPSLPAGSECTVQLSFKLNDCNIEVAGKAALQMDVYLQKIPTLNIYGNTSDDRKMLIIQRRLFEASCQPKFRVGSSGVVLLVTNSTSASQVSAWKQMLSTLGLSANAYSLSRYGHLDPSEAVDEMKLREALANQLVVILNEEFIPRPNIQSEKHKKCRPSELLGNPYGFGKSTKFLVVGGYVRAVRHLAPTSRTLQGDGLCENLYMNMKACKQSLKGRWRNRRSLGYGLEPSKSEIFEVIVKTKTLFKPSATKRNRILATRAKALATLLQKNDPEHPYTVEWRFQKRDLILKKGLITQRNIGELKVFMGPSTTNSILSFVEERWVGELVTFNNSVINSRAMMYATMKAAPFDLLVRCCSQNLSSIAVALNETVVHSEYGMEQTPNDNAACAVILEVIHDCLVTSFIKDVTNFYHGRQNVKDAGKRSPTLYRLRHAEDLNVLMEKAVTDHRLKQALTHFFSKLIGAFRCVARSKDLRPWWNPISWKHQASRQMVGSLKKLSKHWENYVDKDLAKAERRCLKKATSDFIKERKKSKYASVRVFSRYRAALTFLHTPQNTAKYQHTFHSLRFRDGTELLNGDARKTKKYRSRIVTSSESAAEARAVMSSKQYCQSVMAATVEDRGLFMRNDL